MRRPWPTVGVVGWGGVGWGGGLLRLKQTGWEGNNKPSVNLMTGFLTKLRSINQGSVII